MLRLLLLPLAHRELREAHLPSLIRVFLLLNAQKSFQHSVELYEVWYFLQVLF